MPFDVGEQDFVVRSKFDFETAKMLFNGQPVLVSFPLSLRCESNANA